jgi:protein TonB
MFEKALATVGAPPERRRAPFAAAIGAHGVVVATLVAASYLTVIGVVDRASRPELVFVPPPPQTIWIVPAEAAPVIPAARGSASQPGPAMPGPTGGGGAAAPAALPAVPGTGLDAFEIPGDGAEPVGGAGLATGALGLGGGTGGEGTVASGGDVEGAGGRIHVLSGPGDLTPPDLVEKVDPVYPEAARVARIEGRVVLQAVIDVRGDVEQVEVLSSTSPLLEDAAVEAVSAWKYAPAQLRGEPVAVYFTVVVRFVLK